MSTVKDIRDTIMNSGNIVAFTGAGVSTESNIPDFRSANGLYNNGKSKYDFPPEVMLSHSFFMEHTDLFYDFYKSNMIYSEAKPNDCHKALAELEHIGKLKAVITQNIDGLHQMAGCTNVLELHGTVHRNYCMKCRTSFDLEYIVNSKSVIPKCSKCGGIVKPDVVLYEEMLNEDVVQSAVKYISKADVLLVIGTSLVVYPAAGFVDYYKGSKLILINKTETAYDNKAKFVIHDSAGTVMRNVIV